MATPSALSPLCIIEDDAGYRKQVRDILSTEGLATEFFSDPEAALEWLRGRSGIIIIADLIMPGMPGVQFLQEARQTDPLGQVIVTARNVSVELLVRALRVGVGDVLLKPFGPNELILTVRRCLRRRESIEKDRVLRSHLDLLERTRSLTALLEPDQLYRRAAEVASQIVACDFTAVTAGNAEGMEIAGASGLDPDMQKTMAAAAAASPPPSLAPPEKRAVTLAGRRFKCVSVLLYGAAHRFHALWVGRASGEFTSEDLLRIVFLRDQIAFAAENAERFKDVQALSFVDDLTGLHNDRYLNTVIDREIPRSQANGLEFGLLFIDIDRFKSVVDAHGHLAARKVLIELGRVLKAALRESDVMVHYGGDEFTALLTGTGRDNSIRVAERLRERVASHEFLARERLSLRTSVSIGVACFPSDGTTKQTLLDYADKAMFKAKSRGRNMVYLASELTAE
ncbi:MAG: diguanylate cyclase [Nitrospirae bacterium]|nr:diguanylate cyclase [Nitrospirota bacterium]